MSFPYKEGDCVGFPANTAAHPLKNTGTETLFFLIMEQRLKQNVAVYPNHGKRLYRNSGDWDVVDLENIMEPRANK
ncbi:MAG TPA: hypothetical protein ENI97_03235 [Gammaproteobacteria bacterium]|nr:hypothetical protein [Gammaproteobacteria bacterium]